MIKGAMAVIKDLEREDIRNLGFIGISYLFVIFTYPFLRATTTALYIQSFGAKATPKVWFLSVLVLTLVISLYNYLQKRLSVQKLFVGTILVSIVIFATALIGINSGFDVFAYVLYIWKEIYIVILIHLVLGYLNNCLTYEQAKVLIGPVGAFGSLGGVLGGLVTAYVSKEYGYASCIWIASGLLFFNSFLFLRTKKLSTDEKEKTEEKKKTPIGSLGNSLKYVGCIAAVVALSQFVINTANLKFNLVFEQIVPDVNEKSSYLAKIFSYINMVTFCVQVFLLPFIFSRFVPKTIHIAIPIVYGILSFMGLGLGGELLWAVAGTFVLFKGFDYSLFSASKELLYYPLKPIQKYGAKYLTDMIVYRLAKAVISVFLYFYVMKQVENSLSYLNNLILVFLGLWIFAVVLMFKYTPKKMENANE